MLDPNLYVACLVLRDRPALVVGAGPIALEKVEGLLVCGALVTVVAPDAETEIQALAETGKVLWERREYRTDDLDGRLLVVAATANTDLNTRVYRDAEERSMLVNVVDVPELCNFILPAIVRQGPIAVAVSTSGASPALAKRMKREIGAVVGPEYAELAFLLDEVRDWAKRTLPTYDDRKEFFESIVNGDPDPIELLRNKQVLATRELIAAARREAEERLSTS